MNSFTDINYADYGLGKRYLATAFEDLEIATEQQKQVFSTVIHYANHLVENYKSGRGLVLIGNVDTGKTQLLNLVIKRAIDMAGGYSRIVTETGLLEHMAKSDNYSNNVSLKEIIACYVEYKFLAIDDVGVSEMSNKHRSRLYEVINGRYVDNKPTIISSNYDIHYLEKHLGKRIFSRLTTRTDSDILMFNWQSYSGEVA